MEEKAEKMMQKIAKQYQLKLLLLFGSRASEKHYKESDFDVAYLSAKNLDLMEEARLATDLMPVFKSEKIDLVNLKNASPLLLYAVTGEAKILYQENEFIFPSLRAYAFKRYIENKPLYKLREERLAGTLK